MNKEDILDSNGNYLSAAQLKEKYALDFMPKYVQTAEISAGTKMNCGIANKIPGWGKGEGLQFDLNGVRTGDFETIRGVILN